MADLTSTKGTNYYPSIKIRQIQSPNRLYAFPVLGIVMKSIMLIPVVIVAFFLGIVSWIMTGFINPFYILSTGNYWDTAYSINRKMLRYSLKIWYFVIGLTDTYPGFDFDIHDSFSFEIAKPKKPNKLFAIPLLGLAIRLVLIIPYAIYTNILGNGATFGTLISSFPVFFAGTYPESTFEFNRDTSRVNMASYAYMLGLSDEYPSFYISMKHKLIKIILIVIGLLMFLNHLGNNPQKPHRPYNNQYSLGGKV